MFYQVQTTLNFTSMDEANDFYHDAQVALPKASIINPGKENEERGFIELLVCYHDEQPHKPCEQIDYAQPQPE